MPTSELNNIQLHHNVKKLKTLSQFFVINLATVEHCRTRTSNQFKILYVDNSIFRAYISTMARLLPYKLMLLKDVPQ